MLDRERRLYSAVRRTWALAAPVHYQSTCLTSSLCSCASYLVSGSVIYLVITDKSYPRKLAFAYLDELAKEFDKLYGSKVDGTQRPYAFVGFGASAGLRAGVSAACNLG